MKPIFLIMPLAAVFVIGCAQKSSAPGTDANANVASAAIPRTGAQLWAENCNRCHNYRPATSWSDPQWEAVVMHMRLRADLTGEEQKKITEFMKASH